jgi:hypothetical protein
MSRLPIIQGWQVPDGTGLAKPWWTHPFLAELETWNMRAWEIFEWGSGYSSLWLAGRCRKILTVDDRPELMEAVREQAIGRGLHTLCSWYRAWRPEAPTESPFVGAIDEIPRLWDLIAIDGDHGRNECAARVADHLKSGGIVILDNADWVEFAPTQELFRSWEHHPFQQPDHPDGWRTDYWVKP